MTKEYPTFYCQNCLIPMTMVGIDDNKYVFECLKCKRSQTKIPIARAATMKAVIPPGVIVDEDV